MKCNRCGLTNDVGSRFCNNCAAPFNVSPPQQNPKSDTWKWVFGIVGGLVVLGIINSVSSKPDQPSTPKSVSTPAPAPPKKEASINASVKFSGTQFIITNKDAYNWTNVKLEINGGVFSGGYELKHAQINAGETYTVGALQFADSEGKRFNPFQMKPQKFSICGTTPNGFTCYVGGWD